MKELNIISLLQANKNIDKTIYQKYLKYLGINPKSHELEDLGALVNELLPLDENIILYNNFYFGYIIPQIGKEFDLLRFGEDSIINIELKRTSDEEKIENQLIKNKYYLQFLGRQILSYTYISSNNKLYALDSTDNLINIDFTDLIESLEKQEVIHIPNINDLFDPTNYLVSPFNSTRSFTRGNYFLTLQQEQVKKNVINNIDKKGATFIAISGKAGTGKTLLTYDIAKYYIKNSKNVTIVHCGNLNEGHTMLNRIEGWNIVPAKNTYNLNFSIIDLVIIDETQRIYPQQLEHIINNIKKYNRNCIFAFDGQQCLRNREINNNIVDLINSIASPVQFTLTDKIRTNVEIASFIKCLFDKSRPIHAYERKNVNLYYFHRYDDAKEYIEMLNNEWAIINYTPSHDILPYNKVRVFGALSAHEAVGQEFDNVVAVIDSNFYYDGINLSYKKDPYYNPTKMLFQIVTRTRKKLNVIVINNDEIMERCLDIIKH